MGLSTERVHFEDALLAILATMDAGAGTLPVTRLSIVNYVKAKLDELVPEGEGLLFNLSAEPNVSNPLDLLINAHLDECTKDISLNAPITVLIPENSATAGVPFADPKTGYVILPDNFLRLSGLKMNDWHRKVDEKDLLTTKSPKYNRQANKFLRGTASKPEGVLTSKNIAATAETASLVVKYGYLYNFYAVSDPRHITAANAHVPSAAEWTALVDYLGGANVAGGKLKSTGTTLWSAPNAGATDEVGFHAFPSGARNADGSFGENLVRARWWGAAGMYTVSVEYIGIVLSTGTAQDENTGYSLRVIVDTPIEVNGGSAIYVGCNGRRYPCTLINGVWWTTQNLLESKYRNGDQIDWVPDGTAWSTLVTGGFAAHSNVNDLAYTTVTIPATIAAIKRVIEYYSVNTLHTVDELLYIPERTAEAFVAVNPNLLDALAWQTAGKIMQITGMMDAAKLAQERVNQSYINL